MYLGDLIRRSARSLSSAKTRTLLTAFAISVGTFALTLTLAASNGAQSYVNKIVNDNFDPTELIVTKSADVLGGTDSSQPEEYNPSFTSVVTATGNATQIQELDDADLTRLKNVPGVADVRVDNSITAQYITRPGVRKYIATLQTLDGSQIPDLLAGRLQNPLKAGTVILPQGFLASLGFSSAQAAIGQRLDISVQKQLTTAALTNSISQATLEDSSAPTTGSMQKSFTITAVATKPVAIQPEADLYLYISQSDAVSFDNYITAGTASYHKYTSAAVKVRDGTNTQKLDTVQTKIKQLGYGAESVQDTEKFLTQIISVLQGIVSAFGFIAVVASLFGIVNTMYISVLQRTREIGLMKALGMSRKDISKLFRFEAALIGLLGGLLGSAVAIIAGSALNPWISSKLSLGSQRLLSFRLEQVAVLILILMIVATIAGLLPARKAAGLNPIDALRTE